MALGPGRYDHDVTTLRERYHAHGVVLIGSRALSMYQGEDKVICNLCGETLQAPPGRKVSVFAGERGWDWFTGDRPATFHACPQCRTTRAAEVRAALTACGSVRVRPRSIGDR
jgi:hypothetical protein